MSPHTRAALAISKLSPGTRVKYHGMSPATRAKVLQGWPPGAPLTVDRWAKRDANATPTSAGKLHPAMGLASGATSPFSCGSLMEFETGGSGETTPAEAIPKRGGQKVVPHRAANTTLRGGGKQGQPAQRQRAQARFHSVDMFNPQNHATPAVAGGLASTDEESYFSEASPNKRHAIR